MTTESKDAKTTPPAPVLLREAMVVAAALQELIRAVMLADPQIKAALMAKLDDVAVLTLFETNEILRGRITGTLWHDQDFRNQLVILVRQELQTIAPREAAPIQTVTHQEAAPILVSAPAHTVEIGSAPKRRKIIWWLTSLFTGLSTVIFGVAAYVIIGIMLFGFDYDSNPAIGCALIGALAGFCVGISFPIYEEEEINDSDRL